jgi:predicted Zn finger-like uncharacterized protein
MIAACPNCKTKFRIARDRLGADGVRLRCTQCSSVFRVKAPEETPVPAAPVPLVVTPPAPAPAAAPPSREPLALDPERLVVVAHSDAAVAKQVCESLEAWGLHALSVHDGVEAILAIQRNLPRAVVLDAALPKMFGFQVCELVKRNESLRSIQVVLVGAIYDDTRYRRTPGELYGADLYLETPDLPDGLRAALRDFGLSVGGGDAVAAPNPATYRGAGGIDADAALEAAQPAEEPAAAPVAAPTAAAPVAPSAEDDAVAQAERLARIIVSDVILYNEAKFASAVAAGNAAEAMEVDLAEGRSLFQSRIDPAVAAQRDFLRDELVRVAKQRGMN